MYFGNLHKWLFVPKSAAFLYVRRDHQLPHIPAPACVDNPETQTFTDRYIWTGTRDRTAYCAIADAITFRESLGGEAAIMNYTRSLALAGGHVLVGNWSTRLLGPDSMASSMVSVQVPTDNTTACGVVAGLLRSRYNYYMPASVALDAAHGDIACYWRLSAQVCAGVSVRLCLFL